MKMKMKIMRSRRGFLEAVPDFGRDEIIFHPIPKSLQNKVAEGEEWEGRFASKRPTGKKDVYGHPIFVQPFIPERRVEALVRDYRKEVGPNGFDFKFCFKRISGDVTLEEISITPQKVKVEMRRTQYVGWALLDFNEMEYSSPIDIGKYDISFDVKEGEKKIFPWPATIPPLKPKKKPAESRFRGRSFLDLYKQGKIELVSPYPDVKIKIDGIMFSYYNDEGNIIPSEDSPDDTVSVIEDMIDEMNAAVAKRKEEFYYHYDKMVNVLQDTKSNLKKKYSTHFVSDEYYIIYKKIWEPGEKVEVLTPFGVSYESTGGRWVFLIKKSWQNERMWREFPKEKVTTEENVLVDDDFEVVVDDVKFICHKKVVEIKSHLPEVGDHYRYEISVILKKVVVRKWYPKVDVNWVDVGWIKDDIPDEDKQLIGFLRLRI